MKKLEGFFIKSVIYIFIFGLLSCLTFLIPVNNNYKLTFLIFVIIIFFRLIIPLFKSIVAEKFECDSVTVTL